MYSIRSVLIFLTLLALSTQGFAQDDPKQLARDYFDLAESSDQKNISIVLTHSTSYGLSNAVLSALMRVTLKLSLDQIGSDGATGEIVNRIYEELKLTLGAQDQLTLFYGTMNHRDRFLRFIHLGNSSGSSLIFHASRGKTFEKFIVQGPAISKNSELDLNFKNLEGKIRLDSGDRLVFLSYGFFDGLGGEEGIMNLLNRFRERDSADLLNEIVFKIKSKLGEEDLPAQDCTVMIMDVEAPVLRLTKPN